MPPKNGGTIHNNGGSILQLQVDVFCNDIIQGVEAWVEQHKDDQEVNSNVKNVLSIEKIGNVFSL